MFIANHPFFHNFAAQNKIKRLQFMLPFESDYNNGAHPEVLRHLVETNNLTSLTYGFDQWSKSAREKYRIHHLEALRRQFQSLPICNKLGNYRRTNVGIGKIVVTFSTHLLNNQHQLNSTTF